MPYADGLTLAADAAAVAAALSGDGVDMIGHDIGAGMVARVLAAWPQRVRRAVTMAVPPPATLGAAFTDPAQLQRFFYMWLFQPAGQSRLAGPGRPGRCPLYVRAQLDTAGLSWTQWDLARPKATARETGKIQLTGYFRWWWQVLFEPT
jgi:pimeloyl-ACP methyl ester carboxylesterase